MVEALTYEDIYELLRAEKFATDLEQIKPADLARIKAYLESKKELLKKQLDAMSVLSSQKKIKIQQEIDNATRALKDLYEIRERKIINRALYSVRTDSQFKDTTNMLENEVELYEKLLKILRNQKKIFFKQIENSKIEEAKAEAKSESEEKEEVEEQVEKEKEEKEKSSKEIKEKVKKVKVKFLEECPEVFGEDLEKYGPFKSGDEAALPEQLCSILEKQKKVEQIEEK